MFEGCARVNGGKWEPKGGPGGFTPQSRPSSSCATVRSMRWLAANAEAQASTFSLRPGRMSSLLARRSWSGLLTRPQRQESCGTPRVRMNPTAIPPLGETPTRGFPQTPFPNQPTPFSTRTSHDVTYARRMRAMRKHAPPARAAGQPRVRFRRSGFRVSSLRQRWRAQDVPHERGVGELPPPSAARDLNPVPLLFLGEWGTTRLQGPRRRRPCRSR